MKTYEIIGFIIFIILSALPIIPAIFAYGSWRKSKNQELQQKYKKSLLRWAIIAAFIYFMVVIDAFVIEPNWPTLTEIKLKGNIKKSLKILHLSDLHLAL